MVIQMARRFPNRSSKHWNLKTVGRDGNPHTPGYLPAVIDVRRRAGKWVFFVFMDEVKKRGCQGKGINFGFTWNKNSVLVWVRGVFFLIGFFVGFFFFWRKYPRKKKTGKGCGKWETRHLIKHSRELIVLFNSTLEEEKRHIAINHQNFLRNIWQDNSFAFPQYFIIFNPLRSIFILFLPSLNYRLHLT